MARRFDAIARLWDRIGGMGIGFCLDTCHARAAGEDLIDAAERILAHHRPHRPGPLQRLEGRLRLRADRHANLGSGPVDPQLLVVVGIAPERR